jgi:hypothetical protein
MTKTYRHTTSRKNDLHVNATFQTPVDKNVQYIVTSTQNLKFATECIYVLRVYDIQKC